MHDLNFVMGSANRQLELYKTLHHLTTATYLHSHHNTLNNQIIVNTNNLAYITVYCIIPIMCLGIYVNILSHNST